MVYKNKICLFSEKLYDLSKADGVCSDVRATTILTENECRSAVSKIPGATEFNKVFNNKDWPKGCVLSIKYGDVSWNSHATGSPSIKARQVCNAKPGM